MLQDFRKSIPSPALIVALIALFVALGGTAAALRGSNTVFSNDIVKGAVKNGDLANLSVTNPKLDAGAITGIKVADGSLGGADVASNSLRGEQIDESTLSKVPAAGNADSVDGKNAAQLASGRIHAVGGSGVHQPLLPGLSYAQFCSFTGAYAKEYVYFFTDDANGTVNAMAVASGANPPFSVSPEINISNGAQVGGFPFNNGTVPVLVGMQNSAGQEALAETQLIIDVGARTYSVALHMYQRVSASDNYCEASGTATLAQ